MPRARRLLLARLVSFCLPVSASEGDAYPLGALPVGTLICNLESHPGKGAQYIRAAGVSPLFIGVWLSTAAEEDGGALLWVTSDRELPSSAHVRVQHIPPEKQGQLCPVYSSKPCLQQEVLYLVQHRGALGNYQHGDVLATG